MEEEIDLPEQCSDIALPQGANCRGSFLLLQELQKLLLFLASVINQCSAPSLGLSNYPL